MAPPIQSTILVTFGYTVFSTHFLQKLERWAQGRQPGRITSSRARPQARQAGPKRPCLAASCLQLLSADRRVVRWMSLFPHPCLLPLSSKLMMCPLVRTPNQCCINKAIQHLSFDPSLQDSAWHRAQARPKPYNTADRDKCSRKTERGDVVCDAGILDVLDTLGVSLDPTARTIATKQKPPMNPESSPSASLDHLSHKSLYIPGKQSKSPTSCAEYLKRNPGANRVRMLAEIAACLQYLHSHKIIHGSIRPEALCVDDEGYPLLSYSPETSTSMNSQQPGPYSAPELHEAAGRSRPTIQSDIYSFGSIVHWMCTGKHPYHTEPAKLPLSMREPSISSSPSARPLRSLALNIDLNPSSLQPHLSLKQMLADLTDYTLKTLVSQCRSSSPTSRPMMFSIVLQLQQILVRHVLPTLPLPPPPSTIVPMSSSLSAYLPRARISATTPTSANANSFNHVLLGNSAAQSNMNMTRTVALSPRPRPSSPSTASASGSRAQNRNHNHNAGASANAQNRNSQEFAYQGDYRSDLPSTSTSTSTSPPYSYLDPPFRGSKQYEGGHQDWTQSHSHSQSQSQRPHRDQWTLDSLDSSDFTTGAFSSVPPTPTHDAFLQTRHDATPKLAFHLAPSPAGPAGPSSPSHTGPSGSMGGTPLAPWDAPYLTSSYPSTAGLQPPQGTSWASGTLQGGASVHRNRTL